MKSFDNQHLLEYIERERKEMHFQYLCLLCTMCHSDNHKGVTKSWFSKNNIPLEILSISLLSINGKFLFLREVWENFLLTLRTWKIKKKYEGKYIFDGFVLLKSDNKIYRRAETL